MKEIRKALELSFPFVLLAVMILTPTLGSARNTKQVLEYYQQWGESPHANHLLANEANHGAIIDPGGHDATCMKCHTAGGFKQWAKHDFVMPDPNHLYADKPVKEGTAVPVTCITCHDADGMIRLTGKTPVLSSGYQIEKDLGTGAVCAVCHNSNRGYRNETAFPNATHQASHETSQIDVFMGENFYFIETGKPSPHLEKIPNTCSACHMNSIGKKNPRDHAMKVSFSTCADCHGTSDHSMKASVTICNDCHGTAKMKIAREVYESEYINLKTALESAIASYIEVGLKAGNFKLLHMQEDETKDKDLTTFTKGNVKNINIRYFHGHQAVDITIGNVKKFAFINMLISDGKKLLETQQGQIITKAGWNFYMIDHDGSKGAHNTNVVLEALQASRKHLAKLNFKTLKSL